VRNPSSEHRRENQKLLAERENVRVKLQLHPQVLKRRKRIVTRDENTSFE
jgi:hypothetical protein